MDITQIEEFESEIRNLENLYMLTADKQRRINSEIDSLKIERDNFIHRQEVCVKAIDFVERVANDEREGVKTRVEELITSCLKDVFDDTYSVEFDYGIKRNKTSVEISSIRNCPDGLVVKRTIDGIGGGLADAISMPLKLVVLLNDHELDKIFVIDEPGKHLSSEHVPKFAKFLNAIAHKLGVQIIMSSHHTCMDQYADCVNEVKLSNSVSVVERKI